MPLQENPNLANKRKSLRHSQSFKTLASSQNILSVMKTRSRALISIPTDLKRHKSQDSLVVVEPPKLTVDNVVSSLNMAQVNGLFKEQSPSPQDAPRPGRVISASMMRSAAYSTPETQATAEPTWSSAVGHASTGKSGRVIEKLQGEIDRLRRENQLIKVRFDEVERANEALATRNQYLQDRNSNYEASHEANMRQIDRKERQVQDLREELRREKERTTRAEEKATVATTNEETWKDQASQAKAVAQQKETEYDTVVACRTMDNERHQGGLDRIKANFGILMQQREEDVEKYKKLQIIAEQQRKTIQQLEQLTQKLNANFKAYRTEIDSAIEGLRQHAGSNDEAVNRKLQEMQDVTGQMKWVVNVEHVVNHKQLPSRPASKHEDDRPEEALRDRAYSSPSRKPGNSIDAKGKPGKKNLIKSFIS